MRDIDKIPIQVTPEQRKSPYIMSMLAQQVFQVANYDMSPDNAVDRALELGYLQVSSEHSTTPPMPIRRMPGNGSFV